MNATKGFCTGRLGILKPQETQPRMNHRSEEDSSPHTPQNTPKAREKRESPQLEPI